MSNGATVADRRLRVVFLGMPCPFSVPPLAALLDAGMDVRAVIVPPRGDDAPSGAAVRRLLPPAGFGTRPGSLQELLRQTVVELAWEREIPVLEVGRLSGPGSREALDTLAGLRPDLVPVSCFPFRFPPELLALPPLGCLNLHPSLLPANRGPDPLFWTFREGFERTGVTVHLMDGGLDSGPIVAQQGFDLSDGLTAAELELRCAALGGELLAEAVRGLAGGTVTPVPQDEARASVYGFPAPADFVVTPDRPARWAFNFIRGTAGWGHPHVLDLGEDRGPRFTVASARAYDPGAILGARFVREGDELRAQCSPGVLTVTIAD